MTHGEIFTAMGIFPDRINDEPPAMSGWARANPGNDAAVFMRVPVTNTLDAWFMPSCSEELDDPWRNSGLPVAWLLNTLESVAVTGEKPCGSRFRPCWRWLSRRPR